MTTACRYISRLIMTKKFLWTLERVMPNSRRLLSNQLRHGGPSASSQQGLSPRVTFCRRYYCRFEFFSCSVTSLRASRVALRLNRHNLRFLLPRHYVERSSLSLSLRFFKIKIENYRKFAPRRFTEANIKIANSPASEVMIDTNLKSQETG